MANLLLMGTFGEGALELFFKKGFEKLGYNVSSFEILNEYIRSLNSFANKCINRIDPNLLLRRINQKSVQFCKIHRPHIIFICKGVTLFPETIEELKSFCNIIINYNPDHPFRFFSRGSGNNNISKAVKLYDIFFTYSRSIAEQLVASNINAYTIPFGYDDSVVHNDNSAHSVLNRFLFIGAWDQTRAAQLELLNKYTLEIYGDDNWRKKTYKKPFVMTSFQGRKLYGKELIEKVRSYTGSINILREQNLIEKSHNMRTFEVPGWGGLLLSQFTEEQATFFEPDKEAIFYNSVEELLEKMQMLNFNETLVKNIKEQAINRSIKSGYSYNSRCLEMSIIIQKHLK